LWPNRGYTLVLKKNHPEVYAEAQELFEGIYKPSCSVPPAYTDVAKDHGRIEKREAWLCADLSWFVAWAGLMAMDCIRSRRTVKGTVTTEIRYYLTTLTEAAAFARSVRPHGGIKNRLHWILDVVFREAYARNRKDHSTANLTLLRKITLNLIRLEPMEKLPLPEVFSQPETALRFL
jgi:predicted transposase YbfD/YdcC